MAQASEDEVLEGVVVFHEGAVFNSLWGHVWATDGTRYSPSYHAFVDPDGTMYTIQEPQTSWGATQ